jgi:hypothetical protein
MLKFVPFCIDASKNGLSLLIAAYAAYPLNEPCAPDSSLSLSRHPELLSTSLQSE